MCLITVADMAFRPAAAEIDGGQQRGTHCLTSLHLLRRHYDVTDFVAARRSPISCMSRCIYIYTVLELLEWQCVLFLYFYILYFLIRSNCACVVYFYCLMFYVYIVFYVLLLLRRNE